VRRLRDSLNYYPFVPEWFDPKMFGFSVSLIFWAYAGHENVGAMAEEIQHPRINIPRAMFIIPVVVFSINIGMQWIVMGIIPDSRVLQDSAAPFAYALQLAGAGGFVFLLFMLAEFLGNFSTINPLLTGGSRTLFALGRDGYLPTFLGKISKRGGPGWAIIVYGIAMIVLHVTKGLFFIAQFSACLVLFLYTVTALTLIASRITRKDVQRTPYRIPVPLYPIIPVIAMGVCVWLMFTLPSEVIYTTFIWLGANAVFFLIWTRLPYGRKERAESKFYRAEAASLPEPGGDEKSLLNKNFRKFMVSIIGILLLLTAFLIIT